MFSNKNDGRVAALQEEIDALHRALEAERADHGKTRKALNIARTEANELREKANADRYVTRTDSGAVLYDGDNLSVATATARAHYAKTGEHSEVDGHGWNTRANGGTRRLRRAA